MLKTVLFLGMSLGLTACIDIEDYRLHGEPPAPAGVLYAPAPVPYEYEERRAGLSDLQEKALHDGCMLRYNQVPHKLHDCLNQGANWRDALAQGCEARYNQVPHKLRECMAY